MIGPRVAWHGAAAGHRVAGGARGLAGLHGVVLGSAELQAGVVIVVIVMERNSGGNSKRVNVLRRK